MNNANAYETTFGKLMSVDHTVKDLEKLAAVTPLDTIGYEYDTKSGKTKVIFVVGYGTYEKDINMFEHPIIFSDLKGTMIVASDVRKYVKKIDRASPDLASITRDKAAVDFIALRALANADILEGNYGFFRNMYQPIILSYSNFVSYMINSIVALNPAEKLGVEVACAVFMSSLLIDSDDTKGFKDTLAARLSTYKFSIALTKKVCGDILESIPLTLKRDQKNIMTLIDYIRSTLPPEKAELISVNTLTAIAANGWYGPGVGESIIIGLEHVPTWIALAYSSLTSRSYNKCRLATILDKAKRQIGVNDFVKFMDLYLKEKSR